MRFSILLGLLFSLISNIAFAQWQKINEADYTWGPFKIYHISLFSESGEYQPELRPLMLSLDYEKPVDGRDFAISIARSWANLGIQIENQEQIIDQLRKELPDLKPQDRFSYIALSDKGYFVHNETILPIAYSPEFSQALLAIWLDPKTEWSAKLTQPAENNKPDNSPESETEQEKRDPEPEPNPLELPIDPTQPLS